MHLSPKIFLFLLAAYISLLLPSQSIAKLQKWKEVNNISILIDGEMDHDAGFYISEDKACIMILSSAFNDALVLRIKDGTINALSRTQVWFEDDELVALTDENAQSQYLANYIPTGSVIKIKLEGLDVSIVARPHLVGKATPKEIMDHTSAYRRLMDRYEANPTAIKFLSKYNKPVNILIAFGTWCPHCKKWIPRLMKSISLCDNPNLNCTYFGVSQSFDEPKEILKKNDIRKIPSVIVFDGDGQELGRIKGTPNVSMEDDLVAILKGTYPGKEN